MNGTLEAYSNDGRSYRGGIYAYNNSPANRTRFNPDFKNYDGSSRATLYIK